MTTTILVDWSQMVLSNAFAFSADFEKGKDTSKQINILRHSILTTILGHQQKFSKGDHEVVIACDGRNYWRKEVFPYYKAGRKKHREESKMDWQAVFNIGSQLRQEFSEVFPFKVVNVDRAEGDDVIAVLVKWWQENELVESAFNAEPKKIVIISNDGDFGQLHKYKNVAQWNPILKKVVKKVDQHALLEKVMQGDGGDGIPSIMMPDDHLVNGTTRATPLTKKIKEKAIAQVNNNEQVYFGDRDMDARFIRNKMLIDFDYIPKDVEAEIIDKYTAITPIRDKNKIFNYFIMNRCKNLMARIQEF